VLQQINERAIAALEQDRFDPRLENLKKVHARELPVLIHCAGAEGVADAVRMWHVRYGTRCVVSHGCFDGWKVAPWLAELGVPVNQGPRLVDYVSSRTGRIEPIAHTYWSAGVPNYSLNTDSSVIPQEQFFLQGAVAARQGVDGYQALRALTIHPARAFGIDDRVGSLETGKDADVVLWSGDPLDPRSKVELVLIDGEVQYDRKENGQWS
jgi:imidazolonepropionase-like amidohydrolase